jgi:hypothetical protein
VQCRVTSPWSLLTHSIETTRDGKTPESVQSDFHRGEPDDSEAQERCYQPANREDQVAKC